MALTLAVVRAVQLCTSLILICIAGRLASVFHFSGPGWQTSTTQYNYLLFAASWTMFVLFYLTLQSLDEDPASPLSIYHDLYHRGQLSAKTLSSTESSISESNIRHGGNTQGVIVVEAIRQPRTFLPGPPGREAVHLVIAIVLECFTLAFLLAAWIVMAAHWGGTARCRVECNTMRAAAVFAGLDWLLFFPSTAILVTDKMRRDAHFRAVKEPNVRIVV